MSNVKKVSKTVKIISNNNRMKRRRDDSYNSNDTTITVDDNKRVFKKPRLPVLTSSVIQSSTVTGSLSSSMESISTTETEVVLETLLSKSPVPKLSTVNENVPSLSTSSDLSIIKSTSPSKVKDSKKVIYESLTSNMANNNTITQNDILKKVRSTNKQRKSLSTSNAQLMKNESISNVKIIETKISIPSKNLEVVDNFCSSSSSLNDKTNKSLYIQSVMLVACLSILAAIRMFFPFSSTQQHGSYAMVPFQGKIIGMKLRGSYMPEIEINKPIVENSITISSQKFQSNYSNDNFYTFSGRGIGLYVGNSSSYDDDIRELLSSYSLPIATLPSYIMNRDDEEKIKTVEDQIHEDIEDIGNDMVNFEKELYEHDKNVNQTINKQKVNQDRYDSENNECKNTYFYDMIEVMNSFYCSIDKKDMHDDDKVIHYLPRRKLFKTNRWLH